MSPDEAYDRLEATLEQITTELNATGTHDGIRYATLLQAKAVALAALAQRPQTVEDTPEPLAFDEPQFDYPGHPADPYAAHDVARPEVDHFKQP